MAQTNFTPILLYASSTPTNVPSAGNLTNSANGSEIAINIADKNLFFKDNTNAVNTVPIRQSSTSSNGWLSSTDWNTFNNKSNTNGTVTSVAALTIGTTGTDLSSTVANGTTTPVITLQVPTASATNRGALSSADWSTFNSKAPGVTFTSNYVPYGQGTTTLNQSSSLQFNGTALSLGLAASAWSGFSAVQIGNGSSLWSSSSAGAQAAYYSNNLYYNGSNRIYINTGFATEYVQSSGIHYWYTAASGTAGGTVSLSESMRIDTNGALRINATGIVYATGEYLSVATGTGGVGAAFAGTNTSYTLGVWNKGTSSPGFVQFAQGTSGLPCGSISFNGTLTVYATTSDQRLKTDVGVATDTSVIDNTIIHDFTWKNGTVDRGVFAQEAYKIKPTAVQVGDDSLSKDGDLLKPWGVDYSTYVPDLIVKCQQQDKVIETLLQRITALEQK
jgi:hypothetical protein